MTPREMHDYAAWLALTMWAAAGVAFLAGSRVWRS